MKFLNHPLRTVAITTFVATAFQASPANAQQAMTLDKVKSSGSITVGYRESSIPFSFLGDDGKPQGFGWAICNKIVEQVKKAVGRSDIKVLTQNVTSQNRIPLLQNGTVDIECGSTTNNADRNKQVAFAINYFYTGTRFLVNAKAGIKSIDDLKGKRVSTTVGTTNLLVLRKVNADRDLGMNLVPAKDHGEAMLLLQQGRVDAFGMDDILLFGLRANLHNPADFVVVGDPLQVEPYAIMLRKDDPAFKSLVDETITALIRNGEFETLYNRWFQSPIPPRGINLNAPMSSELLDNLKLLSDKPVS